MDSLRNDYRPANSRQAQGNQRVDSEPKEKYSIQKKQTANRTYEYVQAGNPH